MKLNNKNILGAALTLAIGAGLAGCNDYLDITPPSQVTPESYFSTAEQLGAYTINYYARGGQNGQRGANAFPHFGYSGSGYQFFMHDDMGTDNECGTSVGNEFYEGDDYKVGSGTGGSWGFGTINDLNYYLETVVPLYRAGKISGDKEIIEHYIGEGYMLRAIEYYKKLRALGDFPIIKTTLDLDREQLVEMSKRAPRNQVARFILSDLDSAIKYLSDGSKTGGRNRITRDVAYLEKARVALYEGTFEYNFAGTPFVPDASAGWPGAEKDYNQGYSYDNATEYMFFIREAMEAAKYVADRHPALTTNNKKVLGATFTGMPKNEYYALFSSQDVSSYDEALMYRTYILDISGGHSFNQYMKSNNGFTQEFANAFLMTNGLPIYDPNSGYAGDDFVQDTKKNRDYRWQMFMKAPNEYVYEGDGEQKIGVAKDKKTTEFLVPGVAGAMYCSSTTGYQKGKGFTTNGAYAKGGNDLTAAICYRSAEAYLIYMEACWYAKGDGLDADAWAYWTKLRERAGLPGDAQVTIAATDLDKEWYTSHDFGLYSAGKRLTSKVLYNIRRERRCELMSEGFRYDDLVRWRAFDQLITEPYYMHGCKVFGPMLDYYPAKSKTNGLNYDMPKEDNNNVSSPSDVEGGFETAPGQKDPRYLSLFRIHSNNKFYPTGMTWKMAHYLQPINYGHFIESASDNATPELSRIYQNPYWSLVPDAPAQK